MANTGFQIKGSDIIDTIVPASFFHQGAIRASGENSVGALGIGITTAVSSPVQVANGGNSWKQVGFKSTTGCGLRNDGTLWTWGWNNFGQLGYGAPGTNTSTPVQVGSNTWKMIATGAGTSTNFIAAIANDGSLWTWGQNSYGQLGLGDTTNRSSPTQVGTEKTWRFVSTGASTTYGIKTDGSMWSWGRNRYFSQLGDGVIQSTVVSSPIQTGFGSNDWKFVSAGGYVAGAIKTDGTLWMWGDSYGANGYIGNGIASQKCSTPVQTLAGGTTWKMLSVGKNGMAAIKNDGTLWTWGTNSLGNLGLGDTTNRSSPTQVPGNNWKYVHAGSSYTMGAIKTDGTIWVWGDNTSDVFGLGNTNKYSSPIQLTWGGSDWKFIHAGTRIFTIT